MARIVLSVMSNDSLQAIVHSLKYEAEGVVGVELRPANSSVVFPEFGPGAHIDLTLGNGLVRSYSLVNLSTGNQRYVIGVLKDRNSRGGSKYVHEQLRVGQFVTVSTPRNHFKLNEVARHSVLVAGGIGITPIYCMLQRLVEIGRSVDLIYCARNRASAAFLAEIEALVSKTALNGGQTVRVHYHFDSEQGGAPDLSALFSAHDSETHFYCCGPSPMLNAFVSACACRDEAYVHLERFAAGKVEDVIPQMGYVVELKKSKKTVQVSPGASLLDAVLDAGLTPSFSCREGICGACETRVLEGTVDHRDQILTKAERAANNTMMICVSGCSSGTLVLDL